ncbi:hypothetical protein HMPREF1548_03124 [Clostridium sp. KLE 1755]|nr:hypothetical protein HMPREF1548_03124 [Clostridium sp. KLE 1755]
MFLSNLQRRDWIFTDVGQNVVLALGNWGIVRGILTKHLKV